MARSAGGTGTAVHFEAAKYESTSVNELLVYAYFAGDGDLSGRMLGSQIHSGLWKGSLIKPSGETRVFELQVRADGHFRTRLPPVAEFSLTSRSLSIRLAFPLFGGICRRCWAASRQTSFQVPRYSSSRSAGLPERTRFRCSSMRSLMVTAFPTKPIQAGSPDRPENRLG